MTEIKTGTIVKLMIERNYGFINISGSNRDIFFQFGDVEEPCARLFRGDTVKFETVKTTKGLKALKIRRTKK